MTTYLLLDKPVHSATAPSPLAGAIKNIPDTYRHIANCACKALAQHLLRDLSAVYSGRSIGDNPICNRQRCLRPSGNSLGTITQGASFVRWEPINPIGVRSKLGYQVVYGAHLVGHLIKLIDESFLGFARLVDKCRTARCRQTKNVPINAFSLLGHVDSPQTPDCMCQYSIGPTR